MERGKCKKVRKKSQALEIREAGGWGGGPVVVVGWFFICCEVSEGNLGLLIERIINSRLMLLRVINTIPT
ncbi:hypothetical protein DL95DRAFT_134229 [Leptodontidium sp. 2 PMI_412]|nr:hypothetical protein DL95DRAFT_134229 [Leptodontidium sp. 2 PMI_412]